ncbi:Pectin lyase-like superfamily protein [Rhynchospora pubera]|uniref:Pectin lyase-like superfamily protein n=1 Tax=Rhynchospora pubera TaxID=906938 RepID=A0AAV8F7I0_9POAL|nr:Pectin lyase-like superfamily protein [Rhynchospora pubera]
MKSLAVLLLFLSVLASDTGNGIIKCWGQIIESDAKDQCKTSMRPSPRPHSVTITEFGAVGDGKTLNTLAFQNAIFYLKSFTDKGGAQLYVPKGKWLTGSFNLTSHLTLFLERGATIIATEDSSQWPKVEPLPSYGQGIDLPGPRHRSLINGYNVTDVVITGNEGEVDGQGSIWWEWYLTNKLNYSRPHLVEFVNSKQILVSNLTFLNSPAWGIHAFYCRDVQIKNVTINASPDSPLTNGIVPDSSSNVCIENCAIAVGNDPISLKSGWDNYGLSFNKPTYFVYITNVLLEASSGSAISLGSEMSGGISDVTVDQTRIRNSSTGISFKTAPGRGGFIDNVIISGIEMENVYTAIEFTGQCKEHPAGEYDPSNLPVIDRISLKDIVANNVSQAGVFYGIEGDPFTGICLSNITVSIQRDPSVSSCWICSNVSGFSESVVPDPCTELQNPSLNSSACFSSLNKYSLYTVE